MWQVQFYRNGKFRCFKFAQKDSAESFFEWVSAMSGTSQAVWGFW